MSPDELIAALEAAEKPSRDLDFAIFRVIRPEYAGPEWQPYGPGLRHINDSSDMRSLPDRAATPGAYTSSLDAALTLVPEGWTWTVEQYASGVNFGAKLESEMGDEVDHGVFPAPPTPALALCIAAIKARQVTE